MTEIDAQGMAGDVIRELDDLAEKRQATLYLVFRVGESYDLIPSLQGGVREFQRRVATMRRFTRRGGVIIGYLACREIAGPNQVNLRITATPLQLKKDTVAECDLLHAASQFAKVIARDYVKRRRSGRLAGWIGGKR